MDHVDHIRTIRSDESRYSAEVVGIGSLTDSAVARSGPNVDHMTGTGATLLERAIGLTVVHEARRKGMTHKRLQELTGINDKTFRRYFVACERHIPMDDLAKVASALELPLSQLMAMAEEEALHIAPEAIPGLAETEQDDLRSAIERARPSTKSTPRTRRDVG